jgi:hypothetical protein
MIFRPFNPSNPPNPSVTLRRVAAALLLSATLALTCAAPSHAWPGCGHPTIDAPDRTPPEAGIFRFLVRMFGFAGGTMDPNGNQ